jgi:hypothetical protein
MCRISAAATVTVAGRFDSRFSVYLKSIHPWLEDHVAEVAYAELKQVTSYWSMGMMLKYWDFASVE